MAENEQEFQRAARQDRQSIISDFFHFLADNKKWWLVPIIVVLLLVGVLLVLGSSGAAPFIYTLF